MVRKMRVLQFCLDASPSSGVNCFCTQLNEALGTVQDSKFGVQSVIVRSYAELLSKTSNRQSSLILHIHGIWLKEQNRAAVWARKNGVPVVWSAHGMTSPWAVRNKWWKKIPAWWIYQRRNLRGAALLHVTSELERTWNRALGLKNETIVAPLGTHLPAPRLSNTQTIKQSNNFTVLFVGRIHPVKGLMSLVRAAAILNQPISSQTIKQANNPTILFRLVGPDECGHRDELQAECDRLGVSVEFVGEKHGEDLEREYENCDILVLPSFTENFGGVVVDALAHGKPVIASRFTPWEHLETARCGWWVENSPESLAKAIAAAAKLPRGERARMGERGRKLVEENYTWQAVARKMAEAYGRLGV